jgi:hypothetical protein
MASLWLLLVSLAIGSAGCVPGLGPSRDGDDGAMPVTIAAPCELLDRIDVSAMSLAEDRSVDVVCDPTLYPPPVPGRGQTVTVFLYVDYVYEARSHGLRKQTLSGVSQIRGQEFQIFELFCANAIEFAGLPSWATENTDSGYEISRLEVDCP